jgi:AcrR family transcriptional regulator
MKAPVAGRTERQTAGERREEILLAAVREFAQFGLHGASIDQIARQIGISQPYIYRLFGTKKDLFLAVLGACYTRITTSFEAAAATARAEGRDTLAAMGVAFGTLLADRDELLVLLHGFAACDDVEIRTASQRQYGSIYQHVAALSGANREEMSHFMAQGMLLMVAAAMDLPSLSPEHKWACDLLTDPLSDR